MNDLHLILQFAFGWTDDHLYQFEVGGVQYGDVTVGEDSLFGPDCEDASTLMLSEVLADAAKGFRFAYTYDFGDSWDHEIRFEGCVEAEARAQYPRCSDGRLSGPPEDVGGVWGYYQFLEVLADPSHERYEETLEWIGPFDPEAFDLEETNRALKPLARRQKRVK